MSGSGPEPGYGPGPGWGSIFFKKNAVLGIGLGLVSTINANPIPNPKAAFFIKDRPRPLPGVRLRVLLTPDKKMNMYHVLLYGVNI